MSDRAVLAVADPTGRSWRGVTVRDGSPEDVIPALQALYDPEDPAKLVVELIDGHPGWDHLPDVPLGPAAGDFEIRPDERLVAYQWVYVLERGGTVDTYAADPQIAWRHVDTTRL